MTGLHPAVVQLDGSNLVLVIVVAVIALAALGMAVMFRKEVLAAGEGTDNMKNIAHAVQEGASAYLTRQFRTLGIFAAVAFVALLALPADDIGVRIGRSLFFLLGAGFSASIGYLGMSLAVQANLRVAAAANRVGPRPGHEDRLPHRRVRRHGDRGPGPARRQRRGPDLQGPGAARARGLRLRCRAARHVHAGRRRHLHQGRRRRRRPGRQGRAEHPRGRPAQRRDDRRQRRRQRRRLRRHGRRPVRVLRRDAGRGADPRLAGLRRQGPGVPADHPRDRCADRGPRGLHHRAPAGRERPEDDQPVVLHLRRRSVLWRRSCRLHLPAEQLRRLRRCRADRTGRDLRQLARRRPAGDRLGRRGHRHRAGRRHPGADRLLHRHRAQARSRTSARPR